MMRVTVLKAPTTGGVSAIVPLPRSADREVPAKGGYYTETPDPPGRWWGSGCSAVGLAGEVEPDQLERMLEATHPLTGRRVGRSFGEKSARAYDATASRRRSRCHCCGRSRPTRTSGPRSSPRIRPPSRRHSAGSKGTAV